MRIPPWALGCRLACAAFGVAGASCVPQPEMCTQTECGAQSSCVAGRCVGHGSVVAIASARRLVFSPLAVACVRCGASPEGPPPEVWLGRANSDAVLLLRFAVDLPPDATLVEAYLDLERVDGADVDPAPIALHAARVVGPWDERSISWARLPRLDDLGAPVTRVEEASGPRVRVDVRDIVQRWRSHARGEFGVAVLADGAGATGMPFALRPTAGSASAPELELYVK